MKNLLTKQELIDFELDIADTFNSGLIKAPIHLYSGNEDQMIDIFKNIFLKTLIIKFKSYFNSKNIKLKEKNTLFL